MSLAPRLRALLHDTLEAGRSLRTYYAAAQAARIALDDALQAIEEWAPTDDGCHVWLDEMGYALKGEDPFVALIAHVGSWDAQEIVERSGVLVDVDQYEHEALARYELDRAFRAWRHHTSPLSRSAQPWLRPGAP